MDPITIAALGSAVIGGAASYFGQSSANDANRDIAAQANQQNAAINATNNQFQERMSNTSWQRGVKDMRAAGINPMLAVSKGGASTPTGSTLGAVTGAPMQSTTSGFSDSINTALRVYQAKADVDNTNSSTNLNNVNSALSVANAKRAGVDTDTALAKLPKERAKGQIWSQINDGLKWAITNAKTAWQHRGSIHPNDIAVEAGQRAGQHFMSNIGTSWGSHIPQI
jgi:hypothetical protein